MRTKMSMLMGTLVLAMSAVAFAAPATSIYDFTLKSIDGQQTPLSSYHGKVVLLVNVASRCGFTPQYAALETLYEKYKDRGLVIVGVPANNFMGQEPGTDAEIKTFCTKKYNVIDYENPTPTVENARSMRICLGAGKQGQAARWPSRIRRTVCLKPHQRRRTTSVRRVSLTEPKQPALSIRDHGVQTTAVGTLRISSPHSPVREHAIGAPRSVEVRHVGCVDCDRKELKVIAQVNPRNESASAVVRAHEGRLPATRRIADYRHAAW